MLVGFLRRPCRRADRLCTVHRDAAWVDTVTTYVTGPIGQIFLRLMFMLVMPLLFSALVVGIAGDGRHPRARAHRLARRWPTRSSSPAIAVVLGLVAGQPAPAGRRASIRRWRSELLAQGAERRRRIVARQRPSSRPGIDMLIVASCRTTSSTRHAEQRTILAVMFFALMFGIGLVLTPTPRPHDASSAASRACSRCR